MLVSVQLGRFSIRHGSLWRKTNRLAEWNGDDAVGSSREIFRLCELNGRGSDDDHDSL